MEHRPGELVVIATVVVVTLTRFALSRQLTIEVTAETVRWWFMLGWARGGVARDRIVAASTRSMWWYRYGVSGTLYGRMWITGPGTMVQLDCRPGPSALLRYDDPYGLLGALGLTDAAALPDAPFETRPKAAPQGDTIARSDTIA